MRENVLTIGAALCLAAAPSLVCGQPAPAPILNCDDQHFVTNGLVTYCQVRETSAPFGGSLSVDPGANGGITVQKWDGPDVLVRAEVQAAAANLPLAVSLYEQVGINLAAGSIRVSGPASNQYQNWGVNFEIYVPEQAALTLTTLNGGITVEGLQGSLSLTSTNGGIAVSDTTGPVRFNVINGAARLVRVTGSVTGQDVNGTISTDAGAHWQGQTLDLTTVNGNIEMDVPSDCSAHVEVSTGMGSFSTNFPVPNWGPSGMGQKLSFDVGSGGPTIHASTTLGNIRLAEAAAPRDGRRRR